MEMDNRNEPTDMDLIDSPRRTPTPPPLSACEQILQTKAQLQKMETFKSSSWPASLNFKPCPITTRMSLSQTCRFELQEVEETINLAVSDLASFPPCVSPGCPHHDSGLKIITPKNSPDVTPTKRVLNLNSNRISNKRKEESDFEYPPLRKTTKKQILNIPNDSISISPNRFSLPSDSNIEEITGSQNAIPVVTPKPPSATGPTPFRQSKPRYNDTWNARLEALNTTDNSLWEAQRFLKNKRSQIPTLNCATGMAVTDPQKANLLANTIKNNFIENNRMQDNYDQDDEVVTSAVNTFLSSPFYSN
ncbi:hypothetical protein TNCV_3068241 [Trichonephila clavipes]|nr:hypothetical protein TNCV_3068241 [Trichonephila clavipes]